MKIDATAKTTATSAALREFADFADPLDMRGEAWMSEEFAIGDRAGRVTVHAEPADRQSDAQFVVCVDTAIKGEWVRILRSHYAGPFEPDAEISLSCSARLLTGDVHRVRVLADKPEAIGIKVVA